MPRFARNRWWAFILTLCVLFAGSATWSTPSHGNGPDPIVLGGGPGGSGAGGDPDGPSGPSNRSPYRGSANGSRYAATTVGDGSPATRVWSWGFHVVLQSLLGRYIRF